MRHAKHTRRQPKRASTRSFDAAAARAFGGVAASLRRNGRKATARADDAMIAATAVAADLPVHTCNPSDFTGINWLDIVAVPHPDHD